VPRGKPKNPEAAEKPGPKPKPEGTTIIRKIVGLYPWEWQEVQLPGEGQTEAVRRILAERRQS
jgi:hypothetical protein